MKISLGNILGMGGVVLGLSLMACTKSEAVAFDPFSNKSAVPGGANGQQVTIIPMSDGTTCYVAHDNNQSHSIAISCLPKVAP